MSAADKQDADDSAVPTAQTARHVALPNSAGSTEKSETREEMETQLLGAAASLFARKGFVGATTRELAKSLGLKRASLYHYLESKQDLLYALCSRAMESIGRETAEAIDTAPPEDRIHSAVRAHLEATLRDQEMHAVVLSELRHLDQDRADEISRQHRSYHQQLRKLIREEQHAGRLRKDIDAKYLALTLTNLLNWTLYWYTPDGSLQPAEIADLLVEIFTNGAKTQ